VAIPAIGTRSNPLLIKTIPDLILNKRGYIVADEETSMTSKRVSLQGRHYNGVCNCDPCHGAGRNAAKAMNEYLKWNTGIQYVCEINISNSPFRTQADSPAKERVIKRVVHLVNPPEGG
jgi:hypothetical protein